MKEKRQISPYLRITLYTVLASMVGGLLGLGIAFGSAGIEGAGSVVVLGMKDYFPVILGFLFAGGLVTCSVGYVTLKRQVDMQRENDKVQREDEELSYRIVRTYSVFSSISGVLVVMNFCVWSAGMSLNQTYVEQNIPAFVLFLGVCVVGVMSSFSSVKLLQQSDPSKKGDPSMFSFDKQWMGSCDEAERQILYQAGYRTMTAMQHAIGIAVVLAVIGAMMFETGVMAIFLTCILWIVLNVLKSVNFLRLQKKKLN